MYHYLTQVISLLVPADLRRGGGGGGGDTAERERLTRGLKRKGGGGGVFFVRARAKKGKGRSFFFLFLWIPVNVINSIYYLDHPDGGWPMGRACAPLTQLHASLLCARVLFSSYGVCAVIRALHVGRREVVL